MRRLSLHLRAISAAALLTLASVLPAGAQTSAPAASPATPSTDASAAVKPFVVQRVGHGRPMILIPGLISSGEVWKGTVEHCRGRYDMHVLTLAGFAGVAPMGGDRFLETERDAIIRYIREQRLDHPVLVGHSLGAFLAFSVASAAPDLVGPVVAVDGVPYLAALGDSTMTPEKMRAQAEMMRAGFATLSPDAMEQQTRMSMSGLAKDSASREMGVRWGRVSDAATAGRAIAEMLTTDLRPTVAAIRTPVLLIASGDGITEAQRAAVLASYTAQVARIPRHTVVQAVNARHFVMLDDPAFLFAAMDRFLEAR
jgi:pimeloyl-ACP methyl ester carboxylesterase